MRQTPGATALRVRQTVPPDPPNPRLLAGVEAFFKTTFALEQQGRVLVIGMFADPLQSAVTLHDLLFPLAYLPWLPAGVQEALIGRLAALARRRGSPRTWRPRSPRPADRAGSGVAAPPSG
jgi:hypothetical protein